MALISTSELHCVIVELMIVTLGAPLLNDGKQTNDGNNTMKGNEFCDRFGHAFEIMWVETHTIWRKPWVSTKGSAKITLIYLRSHPGGSARRRCCCFRLES